MALERQAQAQLGQRGGLVGGVGRGQVADECGTLSDGDAQVEHVGVELGGDIGSGVGLASVRAYERSEQC